MKSRKRKLPWIALALIAAASALYFESPRQRLKVQPEQPRTSDQRQHAQFARVLDGDTAELRVEGRQTRVRLFGIDAPERGQPFSDKSRDKLKEFLLGGSIELETKGTDQYGRMLAIPFVNGTNVCEQMVRLGLAWHFKRYSNDVRLSEAEKFARSSRAGFWQNTNNLVPPWEFRTKRN